MSVMLTADRSHIVLVREWSVRRPGLRRWIGRIGGFGGYRFVVVVVVVVVVAGNIGPWRPGRGTWGRLKYCARCCVRCP